MSAAASWYQWEGDNLLLTIRVQPKARKDEVIGPHDGALKIRITAPPVDGKANAHLIKFLAKTFGVAKSRVQLISGETGRNKRLRIQHPGSPPPGISR